MQDFYKLKVWHKAHSLTLEVYRKTATLPCEGTFGVRAQLRRSAVSIPANIAEGCGRGSKNELARFLRVALGSACELEYLLLLVYDLGWLEAATDRPLHNAVIETKRMLVGLLRVTVNSKL